MTLRDKAIGKPEGCDGMQESQLKWTTLSRLIFWIRIFVLSAAAQVILIMAFDFVSSDLMRKTVPWLYSPVLFLTAQIDRLRSIEPNANSLLVWLVTSILIGINIYAFLIATVTTYLVSRSMKR